MEKLSWEYADVIPKLNIQVWSTDVPKLKSFLKFYQPNRLKLFSLNVTCKCRTTSVRGFCKRYRI